MRRGERLLVGIAWGAATAVIAYALIRVLERVVFPEPNPAMILWSERSNFAWRAAIALYAGGMGVFGGWALAARAPASSARALPAAIAVAAAALAVQGAIWP
jgi:hypothetical protein